MNHKHKSFWRHDHNTNDSQLLQWSQEFVHFSIQHTTNRQATSYMTRADECKNGYHGCEHNQKMVWLNTSFEINMIETNWMMIQKTWINYTCKK